MSMKNYNMVADVIADRILSNPLSTPTHYAYREETVRIANKLSDAFLAANPRFKPELFLYKCRITGSN